MKMMNLYRKSHEVKNQSHTRSIASRSSWVSGMTIRWGTAAPCWTLPSESCPAGTAPPSPVGSELRSSRNCAFHVFIHSIIYMIKDLIVSDQFHKLRILLRDLLDNLWQCCWIGTNLNQNKIALKKWKTTISLSCWNCGLFDKKPSPSSNSPSMASPSSASPCSSTKNRKIAIESGKPAPWFKFIPAGMPVQRYSTARSALKKAALQARITSSFGYPIETISSTILACSAGRVTFDQ